MTHTQPCDCARHRANHRAALSDREIKSRLLASGIGAATLAASWLYAPYVQHGPILCPFRLLTGLPCPGCGLTRSFCACAHGQWHAAFAFHALGPILFFAVIFGLPLLMIESLTRRRMKVWPNLYSSRRLAVIFAFIFGGAHLARLIVIVANGTIWPDLHASLLGQLLMHIVR